MMKTQKLTTEIAMKQWVSSKIGKPEGRNGGEGFSLGQAMEMHLMSMTYLCGVIDVLMDRIIKLEQDSKVRNLEKNQLRPM